METRQAPPTSPTARRHGVAWVVGIVALVILAAALAVPLGVSIILWAPAALIVGLGMWSVWLARRRRQRREGRDWNEVREGTETSARWPAGVVDDRLHLGDRATLPGR